MSNSMSLLTKLGTLVSGDSKIKALKNDLAHFFVNYQKAKVKIAKAKKTFENTRELAVRDFEKTKKTTYDKTVKAIESVRANVNQEAKEVETGYQEAQSKLAVKRNALDELSEDVREIGGKEYPLE
jgi:hypothetical protein